MRCPKCDEGALIKIKFKHNGQTAHLCSYCEGLWFADERILATTGHTLKVYSQGKEHEFDELNNQDQDHQPIKPVRNL